MLNLLIVRETFTDESSIGRLYINGVFQCYTLEDRVRPVKVKGSTAIPYGHYEVIVSFSERFQRPLPLILAVPNFDGIRIHTGNTAKHTEGCILLGMDKLPNKIGRSEIAFDLFFKRIDEAAKVEKMFIEIKQ